MKQFLKFIVCIFFVLFVLYQLIPGPQFPPPPPDSIQSFEPADSESPLRRAYFTNYTRSEVMSWYKSNFDKTGVEWLKFYSINLNYGPEEAPGIIRDQTRSTFLEELAHPFRESVYINGFEPKDPKDDIFIEGKHWRQKIIVRYIPSNVYVRLVFVASVATALWITVKKGKNILSNKSN